MKTTVKTVEPVNCDKREHAEFLFDLAMVCKDEFFNDGNNDIILLIQDFKRNIEAGNIKAFLTLLDGVPMGMVWLEVDHYGVGSIHIGVMPEHRNYYNPRYFMDQFVAFCFDRLDIRKLKACFEPHQAHFEKILKEFGFKKEGFFKGEIMKQGKPVDIVRIGLLQTTYKELKNESKLTKTII